MNDIIQAISRNIWVLIPLAAFTIPITAIIFESWQKYQSRRDAMETIRLYASQGKEPPEAVLAALTRPSRASDWDGKSWGVGEDWEPGSRAERRAERRARRHGSYIVRRWSGAIWCAALAIGFYIAYLYTVRSEGFLIVAIIMACIAAASFLSAILATVFRDK